jgi:hypothetical protein
MLADGDTASVVSVRGRTAEGKGTKAGRKLAGRAGSGSPN